LKAILVVRGLSPFTFPTNQLLVPFSRGLSQVVEFQMIPLPVPFRRALGRRVKNLKFNNCRPSRSRLKIIKFKIKEADQKALITVIERHEAICQLLVELTDNFTLFIMMLKIYF